MKKKQLVVVVIIVVIVIAAAGYFLMRKDDKEGNGEEENGGNHTPNADFTYSPTEPYTNQTVTFDASGSSDEDGDSLIYLWHFDDEFADSGNPDTDSGVTASHIFTIHGEYDVVLSVNDGRDKNDTMTQTVVVEKEKLPTAGLTAEKNPLYGVVPGVNDQWFITMNEVNGSSEQLQLKNIAYIIMNENGFEKDSELLSNTPELTGQPGDDVYFDDVDNNSVLSDVDDFVIGGDGGKGISSGDTFQLVYRHYHEMGEAALP